MHSPLPQQIPLPTGVGTLKGYLRSYCRNYFVRMTVKTVSLLHGCYSVSFYVPPFSILLARSFLFSHHHLPLRLFLHLLAYFLFFSLETRRPLVYVCPYVVWCFPLSLSRTGRWILCIMNRPSWCALIWKLKAWLKGSADDGLIAIDIDVDPRSEIFVYRRSIVVCVK